MFSQLALLDRLPAELFDFSKLHWGANMLNFNKLYFVFLCFLFPCGLYIYFWKVFGCNFVFSFVTCFYSLWAPQLEQQEYLYIHVGWGRGLWGQFSVPYTYLSRGWSHFDEQSKHRVLCKQEGFEEGTRLPTGLPPAWLSCLMPGGGRRRRGLPWTSLVQGRDCMYSQNL